MNPNQNPPGLSIPRPEPGSKPDSDNPAETERQGFTLEAKRLKVKGPRGGVPLNDVSLSARPGDFIILAGAQNAGKLTLIQALAGIRRLNDGQVLLDGNNLSDRNNGYRTRVGFVPRQNVASEDLTVYEAVHQTARLRLGQFSSKELRRRVEDLLEELGLEQQSRTPIRSLDAGQKKQANIAIELVAEPGVLFLDEPTLNLDAHQGMEILRLLRGLARQGLPVIMTDRSAQYLMLADRVGFLSHGSLAWYGPPAEAREYFSTTLSTNGENPAPMDLSGVFGVLEDPEQGSPDEWAERFQGASAYKQYALANSKNKKIALAPDERPLARIRARATDRQLTTVPKGVSGIKQFFILLRRNFTLFRRDRTGLLLVLALPVLLGSLDLLFSSRQMYDLTNGDPTRITMTLALLVFFAMLVGGASWVRSLPKEAGFYRRERQIHLKLLPYVLSRVAIIALLALYQAAVWTGIHYFAAALPGGLPVAVDFFVTLLLTALLGGIIGLVASAVTLSERKALLVFSILLIPQLIFSGALLPKASLNLVGSALTSIMPARFAFEALSTADGHGRDLANDPCWQQLTKAQREGLVDQQKQVCTCLGSNIFKSCSFPGIQQYFVPQLSQAQPTEPDANRISPFPVQPSLRQGETLDQYAAEINTYTEQIESNQADTGSFFKQLRQYMIDFNDWELARTTAISKAEGELEFQFVNYASAFNANLVFNWLILLGIIALFVVLLLIILKGKDLA